MSDSVVFSRRDFLKLVGVGVAGTAAGCAKPPAEKLLPYLVAPEDIQPGVAYWYASTCRECPAGCGVLVKSREGRAIKIEGNPASPLGLGGVCARGHAGLQGLYDPDRVKSPLARNGAAWTALAWDTALAQAAQKLKDAHGKVVVLSGYESGSLRKLAGEFAAAAGGRHVMWEPFGYEAVRAANAKTFGIAAVPALDFGAARCVISFGADFLETFGAPTTNARGFAAMRARSDDGYGHFITVEPRLSTTGANADEWVAVRPGGETALALGLANVIVGESLGPAADRAALAAAVAAFTPEAVAQQTGVPADAIRRLARLFAKQSPSLAVTGGIAAQGPDATALAGAVNLLNHAAGNVGRTVRFAQAMDFEGLASYAQLAELAKQMAAGDVAALVVMGGVNPVYATPAALGFADALAKVPFKLALATAMDETAEACDLALPASHALESFGDALHARGVYALQQAAMRPVPTFASRPAGDVLLALGKAIGAPATWPDTFHDYLQVQWKPLHEKFGAGRDWETFWNESLQKGGVWETLPEPAVRWGGLPAAAPWGGTGEGYALVVTPSANFYDGRGANKGWLQELPDMTSKTVWGSWIEMHPDTAAKLGVKTGDPVQIDTGEGRAQAPAYVSAGIRRDAVAIALGQGHTSYGRYAKDRGVNAVKLLPGVTDAASGALAYQGQRVKLSRAASAMPIYFQQEEKNQHGRGVAQVIPIAALLAGAQKGEQPLAGHPLGDPNAYPDYASLGTVGEEQDPMQRRPGHSTEPQARPDGWQPPAHAVSAYRSEHPVRHPRANPVDVGSYKHANHRWAMAVDLNACTGCAACVVACYSENNIPVVGPELMKRGREMAWIRVDRFEEKIADGVTDVRFVPMMCQHCSDAPCEMVCPVYATYHNPEGLNAQVYNRCVGTRYCSNNCPYKVRAFNWFDYSAPEKTTFAFPEPLNWQLNPDVTVRSKGVMEKCTMCIQRILEGKGNAKDEGRAVRDGEIQTACAQSCPAQAITFGDLLDPASAVRAKSFGERRYWVFEELYTRPGVTYLQRIRRETTSEAQA